MIATTNETHDPAVGSWVKSANGHPDFPIQNLPFGVCRRRGTNHPLRIGVAIGEYALDLQACDAEGLLPGFSASLSDACRARSLNPLLALGQQDWSLLRRELHNLLRADAPVDRRSVAERHLVPSSELEMLLPVEIGDYTDFYASIYHAQNVGRMFRPENPLLPNYKYVPLAYHGRASSIVVSGTPARRPSGQSRPTSSDPPLFGPTRQLDYEMEVGFFIGPGNALGTPIALEDAEDHIFGLCLLNDWSARDIQSWESQPLGPFLAKNFATTISPWVVTLEALAPFRVPAFQRAQDDPKPLHHLSSETNRVRGGIAANVEAFIRSEKMREAGRALLLLGRSNLRDVYWTAAQMLAHHTSNGCNLRTGDLLATGTLSGNSRDSLGCLLELTRRGTEPIGLPTGERRGFLEDGDEIVIRASCESPGAARIGFGACCGKIQASQ